MYVVSATEWLLEIHFTKLMVYSTVLWMMTFLNFSNFDTRTVVKRAVIGSTLNQIRHIEYYLIRRVSKAKEGAHAEIYHDNSAFHKSSVVYLALFNYS